MVIRFLFLSLLTLACSACKDSNRQIRPHLKAEALTYEAVVKSDFEDLSGNPVALTEYKGKKIILNYWATWCRPCIAEMPSMLRAQELLGKNRYVFLLASDQSVETVREFQNKKGFDFIYLKFTGSLAQKQINALPTSFIYNSKGELQFTISGARAWDSPESLKELKQVP